MSLVAQFLNGFTKKVSWQQTVLGDGTELYTGRTTTHNFGIKSMASGGYECTSTPKYGNTQTTHKPDIESAKIWCENLVG